ncbi:exodeoxyribonuclease VII small subunit [Pelotomaculum terephthalicicum JT]|uniref:exodeoxyribonuclease VII small subunit n=1 Tax=Pelotomaculum TaxID=191373 RepID=UPI0009CA25CD|nr:MULTISPECIES: exodeoxyribonuclease VII small subunit [Pelotomaculum]MCG9968526.1 exodeoxyribonuclease VII small subunit [Pelotomaculum terephthalicicum JT]OPX85033.1 MAG: Exodeoxyribonuclease 7 small subunit [Pelotomaculum sp. PtaB.Bin117]OPY62767.1 MAG: Exodeoxyribonuclease 7 small subunit [Pelotomaculum sp. PtaU1.Bin065]
MVVENTAGGKKISFEEAIARLEALVRELEDSRLPLEKALEMFTEGIGLTRVCNEYLAAAEQRIAILTANEKDEINVKEIDALPLAVGGQKNEF